eukprot:g26764.t1
MLPKRSAGSKNTPFSDGIVVQALDKNNDQLWVECPVLTWDCIQQEVIQAPSFLLVSTDRADLLHDYLTDSIKHNLQRFGILQTRKAAIHSTTLLQKNRDPSNKTVAELFGIKPDPRGALFYAELAKS